MDKSVILIMVTLFLLTSVPRTVQAQSVESGTGFFRCALMTPCTAQQLLANPYCGNLLPFTACPSAFHEMLLFESYTSSGALSNANILLTLNISSPFPNANVTQFEWHALSGSNMGIQGFLQVGSGFVTETFALSTSAVIIEPKCEIAVNPSGGGTCNPFTTVISPNLYFRVDWQIEDPKEGTTIGPSLTALDLTVLLIAILPAATISYVALRRIPKPLK